MDCLLIFGLGFLESMSLSTPRSAALEADLDLQHSKEVRKAWGTAQIAWREIACHVLETPQEPLSLICIAISASSGSLLAVLRAL